MDLTPNTMSSITFQAYLKLSVVSILVIDIINYLILEDIKAGLVVGPDISPFMIKCFSII